MTAVKELAMLDVRLQGPDRCLVCGNEIGPGEGVTAVHGERTLRFKCPGCLTRFEADPQRYLAGEAGGCCKEEGAHSPASEWRCD